MVEEILHYSLAKILRELFPDETIMSRGDFWINSDTINNIPYFVIYYIHGGSVYPKLDRVVEISVASTNDPGMVNTNRIISKLLSRFHHLSSFPLYDPNTKDLIINAVVRYPEVGDLLFELGNIRSKSVEFQLYGSFPPSYII